MKQTLLFLLFITTIVACKKSSDNNDDTTPQPQPTWSFSADVDGTTLHADSAVGHLLIDSSGVLFPTAAMKRLFLIDGYCNSKIISPSFADSLLSDKIQVGIYDTTQWRFPGLLYDDWNSTSGQDYTWTTAYFEVTAADTVNKKVSGNFSGTVVGDILHDTVQITNGVFSNIKYSVGF